MIRKATKKTHRVHGRIVHIGESRSAGYWAIIKDAANNPYFAYGRSFLNYPERPRVGWNVAFVVLPNIVGHKLKRAVEISISRPSAVLHTPDRIIVTHARDGSTRISLRTKRGGRFADIVLDELLID